MQILSYRLIGRNRDEYYGLDLHDSLQQMERKTDENSRKFGYENSHDLFPPELSFFTSFPAPSLNTALHEKRRCPKANNISPRMIHLHVDCKAESILLIQGQRLTRYLPSMYISSFFFFFFGYFISWASCMQTCSRHASGQFIV